MAKEDTKFGLMPEDVMGFIDKVPEFKNVTVEGLMTIAPNTDDPEKNRQFFLRFGNYLLTLQTKTLIISIWAYFLWV